MYNKDRLRKKYFFIRRKKYFEIKSSSDNCFSNLSINSISLEFNDYVNGKFIDVLIKF